MGKVIKMQTARAQIDDQTRDRMRRFMNDELTWAEVEGMTFEQAQKIAEVGCDLAARGRLNDARIIFEGLVAGNPKDTSAQAALGTVYERLNRRDEALACYDRALALFEGNVVALASRGELRLKRGDQGGFDDLVRAVQLDEAGRSAAGRRARRLLTAIAQRAAAGRQAKAAGR